MYDDINIINLLKENNINYAKKMVNDIYRSNLKLNCYYTGLCYCREDKYEKAICYFNLSRKYGLDNYLLHYNLGVAYLKIKDYNKAEKVLLDCIAKNNSYTKAYMNLAYIYLMKDDTKNAYRLIKKGVIYCKDDKLVEVEKKMLNIIK